MSLTSYVGGNGTTAYLSIPLRPTATNRNFSSFALGVTKLCPALSRHPQWFGLPEVRLALDRSALDDQASHQILRLTLYSDVPMTRYPLGMSHVLTQVPSPTMRRPALKQGLPGLDVLDSHMQYDP